MSEPQEPLWDAKRVAGAFARVAKEDGAIGADEIMLVIMGVIGEYELKLNDYQGTYLYYIDLAEKTEARIMELERQLASVTPSDELREWEDIAFGDLSGPQQRVLCRSLPVVNVRLQRRATQGTGGEVSDAN